MTTSLTSDPEVNDFPRLTRFYGLSFRELAYMPRWARRLYLASIDQLEAEEQLTAMQVADYPHITEKDRKKIHQAAIRRLTPADTPALPTAPAAPQLDMITRPEEARQKLGGIGIAVVMEKPKQPAPEEVPADA